MNKERRKRVSEVLKSLEEVSSLLEEIRNEVEAIKDEEEEYLENIPDNLQSSTRYTDAENAVENLESAYDWFDNVDIEELNGYLEEAMQ